MRKWIGFKRELNRLVLSKKKRKVFSPSQRPTVHLVAGWKWCQSRTSFRKKHLLQSRDDRGYEVRWEGEGNRRTTRFSAPSLRASSNPVFLTQPKQTRQGRASLLESNSANFQHPFASIRKVSKAQHSPLHDLHTKMGRHVIRTKIRKSWNKNV